MTGYYSTRLAGTRLKSCYEIAPPRIKQYLQSEIAFVISNCRPYYNVLELGCGYGRALLEVADHVASATGVDTSQESLDLASGVLCAKDNCLLYPMNALNMTFDDEAFHLVFCIQNGISAFRVDQGELMREAIRVTRRNGIVLFSSYSPKSWKYRLEWFRLQAERGLIGEIDDEATGNGVIVCKDGFSAATISKGGFLKLISGFNVKATCHGVDDSSLFCRIIKP